MSRDFLSRWSQLKRDARKSEPPPSADLNADDIGAQATEDVEPPSVATEPALSAEELAELPTLDEITAESDMSAFLRKGVPEALRNQALRRMWVLDPAIRDYVGHARDYSYDWNTLGGVPGNGPLLPTDDVQAMLKQVIGTREAAEPSPVVAGRQPGEALETPESARDHDRSTSHVERVGASSDAASACETATSVDPASITAGSAPNNAELIIPRRHGGAKPV